jgi:outer membrane protein OmpA-like peptidoglycan-associated protein
MKAPILTFLVASMLFCSTMKAQEDLQITAKDSIVQSSWIFGVGVNAVNDSGNVFNELFNVSAPWNMVPFPSRISIGRYFKSGLGVEAIGTYNQYKEGKIVDAVVNPETTDYFGLDARLTYDLNKIIGETAWFDPYVGVGIGYTEANNLSRGTYNAVVGFRTWFSDKWGLDFSSSGKWAIGSENGATNHLQHAAGVVYQFGVEKGLSKRGEEKLELLAAIEKEKQRQNDSITAVIKQNEALLLAERLKKEKQAADLAAADEAKLKAERDRKSAIEKRISDLGDVYFALNSSSLTKSSKSILDSLAVIINEMPLLKLRITSHTDARGASSYNQWLSERRGIAAKNYLTSKGIDEVKLAIESFGERQLRNECDDNIYCPEEKHKVNRRAEFIIIQY